MRRLPILILSLILLGLGLGCKTDDQPSFDLTEEELLGIISDLHMSEAIVSKTIAHEKDSIAEVLRLEVCNIHQISPEKLDAVMEELQQYPGYYLKLEKKAAENLAALRDSIKELTKMVKKPPKS